MKVRTCVQSGAKWYTVKEGDSLTSIAQTFYGAQTTPEKVSNLYANNKTNIGIDPCDLKVGLSLAVPTYPVTPPSPPPVPKPPVVDPLPGACNEVWRNGRCKFISCPYPPYKFPCDSGILPVPDPPGPPVPPLPLPR